MKLHIQRADAAFDKIEFYLASWQVRDVDVSAWAVGQHIEHVLKATSTFTVMLLRNRQPDGSGIQKQLKGILLQRDSFPRGVAKAPDVSLPADNTPEEALAQLLLKTRNRIGRLETVSSTSVAHHPYLGEMVRDEAVHFIAIHLDHHLSIIEDIVNAAK